eukprot:gene3046-biopygen12519
MPVIVIAKRDDDGDGDEHIRVGNRGGGGGGGGGEDDCDYDDVALAVTTMVVMMVMMMMMMKKKKKTTKKMMMMMTVTMEDEHAHHTQGDDLPLREGGLLVPVRLPVVELDVDPRRVGLRGLDHRPLPVPVVPHRPPQSEVAHPVQRAQLPGGEGGGGVLVGARRAPGGQRCSLPARVTANDLSSGTCDHKYRR